MDLLPDEEQEQIVLAFGKLLAERLPISGVREIAQAGGALPEKDWQMLADMGLFSLMLQEHQGGAGYSVVEGMLAFREVGRHLTPGPLLGTVLSAQLLARIDHELAPRFAAGQFSAALAEPFDDPDAEIGTSPSGRYRVLALPGATHILFCLGEEWCLTSASPLRDAATAKASVDPSLPVHVLSPKNASPLAAGTDSGLIWIARILIAAQLCGIAEAAQLASTTYASERQQFGKPIGSFQAVKHRCADMAIRSEAAWSQTVYAALALHHELADAPLHATAAKLLASDAANTNAVDNIQNHGGIGFTAELDAHLYLRRARTLEHSFGSTPQLADALALTPAMIDGRHE